MKQLILAVIIAIVMMFGVAQAQMSFPEIDGEFMYLPKAQVLTLGAGVEIADFSKDVSTEPLSIKNLPEKLFYSSSLKASVAWNINGDSERTGLLPDYGGPKLSVDIMKLAKNMGANVNTEVGFTIDTGMFIDVSKLLDSPSVLKFEPAIGASVSIKF